ncbi:ATP-binding protein [Pelomonas sp. APW6]|uniref:histidine kinase n=1 Tax=Roseateles subflavus TaxID=3053353 RepID=A0ABT7LDE4_9BURK|nr:ATP-binding protein [Pelomonas sp. APW6]MDL5030474.1 ATP-binding protein [Pelomonas sp. APW6]
MEHPQGPDVRAVEAALDAADRQQGIEAFRAAMDRRVARGAAVLLALVMLAALFQLAATALEAGYTWPQRLSRMATGAGVLAVAATAGLLAWRGHVRRAAAFFALTTMVTLMAMAALHGNGIMSSGLGALTALIVVLGFMVGPQAAKWGALAGLAGLSLLFGAEGLGWISGLNPGNTPPHASYLVVQLFSCGLAGWLMLRYGTLYWDLTRSLDSSRQLLANTLRAQQQSAQDLHGSERRLRQLLEASHMSVQIFDGATGALRYANTHCLRRFGVETQDELRTSLNFPGGDYGPARARALIHRTLDEGAQTLEWCSQHVDGSPIWWDVKLDRFEMNGEHCVVAFAHDITARVVAEQSLELHRQHLEDLVRQRTAELAKQQQQVHEVLEALPLLLSIRDADGQYLQVNRGFEQASGRSRQEVIGQTVQALFGDELASDVRESDAFVLQRGLRLDQERQMQLPDGRKDFLVTSVPLRDEHGSPYAVLNLSTDITSMKQLHRELAAARDEAERLVHAKSQFLANMSHEIRTPLNAVLGLAQLGEQRAMDPRAAADSFRRIVRAGRHLLGVINDVLDFAKLDSGKLELESRPCELAQVVSDALEMVGERARAKGLRLNSDIAALPAWVVLDALRLTQVLVNLLANAVKFTEHGSVSLNVRAAHGGRCVVFEVNDTGIGIPADKLDSIFTPFEQADSSVTRLYGGSGLGLSISRRLARLMGGDILVRSTPGKGSCFTLELPLLEAPPQPAAGPGVAAAPALAPRSLAGLRILITDDVDINREILHDMLSGAGAHVMATDSGEQAVARVQAQGVAAYDLVLMDVQMPGMDGYEATRRLHEIDPALPVLALTAHALSEERQRSLDAGMSGHICKPVDQESLLRTLAPYPRRTAPEASPAPVAPLPAKAGARAPSDTGSPWPLVPDADFDTAVLRCAGRTELLAKLLSSFARQYEQHLSALEEARIAGPLSVRAYAHRLRGVAANLGLDGLATTAAALEKQALTAAGADLAMLIMATNRALAAHLQAVTAWEASRLSQAA